MTAGGARRGRRDNGLDATEYAVAGDVDPRVGEHLLDVLAAGGIAAYLQPSADLNPVTRTTTVPPRPTDRLYVDRTHLAAARDYLSRLTDEAADAKEPDVETEWARIVAGYHADVDTRTPPWPAAEDVPSGRAPEVRPESTGGRLESQGSRPESADSEAGRPESADSEGLADATHITDISLTPARPRPEPSLLDGLDTFGAHLPSDNDDEGYTPPPPPPLPRISKYAVVGILAIIGGFLLFLFPNMAPIDRGVATVLGFAAILSGFVTLVLRLRSGEDEEDDPDDGAVV
ncbi:DUF308 domain-containing protein [Phytohabitans aurantiacus]|uniref:DUF308 domain-containing protein n=1 Tax=Phytohabitans aurantiacus TaxID=3016789 RepID=A0ABQ5QZY3_9ACTN|nr:DUF308 domain-containing protein [Phytohabitans aurantiacus]GLI00122.1 hypothetical protein Pa4123_53980 [Phytohabitans aurantiacus]